MNTDFPVSLQNDIDEVMVEAVKLVRDNNNTKFPVTIASSGGRPSKNASKRLKSLYEKGLKTRCKEKKIFVVFLQFEHTPPRTVSSFKLMRTKKFRARTSNVTNRMSPLHKMIDLYFHPPTLDISIIRTHKKSPI